MTDPILPLIEPDTLIAGTSAKWLTAGGDYPPPVWTLTYYFVSPAAAFNIVATDNSDGNFLIALTPAATQLLPADLYYWQAQVTDGTDTYTLRTGRLTLEAAFLGAAGGFDNRSQVKRTLDAINALLEGRAVADVDSYTINGRSLTKMRVAELLTFRSRFLAEYKREVQAEKISRGEFAGNRVRTRFTDPVCAPAGIGRPRR